jgi:hypothetical protein
MDSIKITPLLDTLRLEKISDEVYFSKKYKNYISNSRLGLIDPNKNGTPEKFFEGFAGNGIFTDSIRMGSAVHELALQPESFELCNEVNLPTGKMGYMIERLYNPDVETPTEESIIEASDFIGYYKGQMTSNRIKKVKEEYDLFYISRKRFDESFVTDKEVIYLDLKMRQTVSNCLTALKINHQIQKLLHPKNIIGDPLISENEQAILLDVRIDIPKVKPFVLKLKAKLDNYTIDQIENKICVNDIKTLGRVVSDFEINFQNYSYYRELSIYCWLLSLCAKKFYNLDNPTITSNCLVVSTIPQYYTKVYKVTKKDFTQGWNEFKTLLKLVAIEVSKNHKDFAEWI